MGGKKPPIHLSVNVGTWRAMARHVRQYCECLEEGHLHVADTEGGGECEGGAVGGGYEATDGVLGGVADVIDEGEAVGLAVVAFFDAVVGDEHAAFFAVACKGH